MFYSTSLPYTGDATAYFAAIADLPWAIWLDSGGQGRCDILCAQPVATLVTRGDTTEIWDAAGARSSRDDPFDLVRGQLGTLLSPLPNTPFAGGAVGYWGYDLARRLIKLPVVARDAEHLPEMAIGIYDWAVVLDHQRGSARLVSRQRHPDTALVLPEILARLEDGHASERAGFRVAGPALSNFSEASYRSAFEAVQAYLRSGDCLQVNLAQRFAAPASGDALRAYLELRRLSPAPYSAFLDLPEVQILCASPERFLRVRDRMVETKPIKGTRPRQSDARRDAQMARELQQSDKDRAENLMIVDLLRNDLGQSCAPGSIQVPRMFEVESFAQVHHLVSTVTGRLAEGHDVLSLLRNSFPGGSVTGAPKRRAMEIIEELEPNRRGVYCGAIGYVGYDGNMDTNIAIRTLVYSKNEIRCWAGGGIVADSVCESEFQETLHKAAGMLKLLQHFSAA